MKMLIHVLALLTFFPLVAAAPIQVTLRLRGVAEFYPVTQILENEVVVKTGDGSLRTVGFRTLLPEDQQKVLPEMRRLIAERQAREMPAAPPPPAQPTETEAQRQARLDRERARSGTLRTLDGVVRTGVRLKSVELDGITIDHDGGVARIPLKLLPAGVLESLKQEIEGKRAAAKVEEIQAGKMRGHDEWERAQRSTKAMVAHTLSGRVMEQNGEGVLIARLTARADITPGLYAFVDGVSGKAAGVPFTGKVKRSGVWTALDGQTYPKYSISW